MARVLVVDDALFMRRLLIDILVSQGHEIVAEASNAKEAMEKFSVLKPDLMTLDIVMPQESGIDALGAIQGIIKENPKAKILMVSSLGQQSIIAEMLAAGACDFIVKPFQQDLIVRTVNRILKGG